MKQKLIHLLTFNTKYLMNPLDDHDRTPIDIDHERGLRQEEKLAPKKPEVPPPPPKSQEPENVPEREGSN